MKRFSNGRVVAWLLPYNMRDDMDTNVIAQGDCLELLGMIPDESVDLVFTDPPFNVGKKYGTSDRRNDYREWCAEWIAQCFRILKPTGSFYLMTLPKHLEWKMPIMASYGVFINLITWRNVSARGKKNAFWGEYQPIMLYGKTEKYVFHTYAERQANQEDRWGGWSGQKQGQLKDRWGGEDDPLPFVYAGSIIHKEAIIIPGTKKKAHPCQMPLGLPERGIRFSTNENDIVVDPFMGSGTTPIACLKLNRRYIGMEISPLFFQLAGDRINNHLKTPIQQELSL